MTGFQRSRRVQTAALANWKSWSSHILAADFLRQVAAIRGSLVELGSQLIRTGIAGCALIQMLHEIPPTGFVTYLSHDLLSEKPPRLSPRDLWLFGVDSNSARGIIR
jgi:hypothetical protein